MASISGAVKPAAAAASAEASRAAAAAREAERQSVGKRMEEERARMAMAIAEEDAKRMRREQNLAAFMASSAKNAAEKKAYDAASYSGRSDIYKFTNRDKASELKALADEEAARHIDQQMVITNRASSGNISSRSRLANMKHVNATRRVRGLLPANSRSKSTAKKPAWVSTGSKTKGWNKIPSLSNYNSGKRYNPAEKNKWTAYKGKQRGGNLGEIAIAPLLTEQLAWEKINNEYKNLEPEYQKMLPEPEQSPVVTATEPFINYINEFSDPILIETTEEYIQQMSPEEIDDIFQNDNGESMGLLFPMFSEALPDTDPEWIPNIIRAYTLRLVL